MIIQCTLSYGCVWVWGWLEWILRTWGRWLAYRWNTYITVTILSFRFCHSFVGGGVFSQVVATFNHVGGSFNLLMATTGDAWIIPLFSCDQAALQMVFSVCLSVCPSVTPFWLCSHHRIIMKFLGVITNDKSKVHAKGQGQRSKVKVTEVTTQLSRFRTVTPVWIQIWWWNDAYSLIVLRRGALLFFKVIRQISRSHGSKNRRVWPRLGVSGL